MLMCANCLGSGERKSPAMGQPPAERSGEQSPTAEELEIDRLRAELSEVRAELVAMTEHANGQRQRRKEAEEMLDVLRAQLAGAEQIGAVAMRERDQLKTASVLRAMDCVTLVLAEREACINVVEHALPGALGAAVGQEIRARGGK